MQRLYVLNWSKLRAMESISYSWYCHQSSPTYRTISFFIFVQPSESVYCYLGILDPSPLTKFTSNLWIWDFSCSLFLGILCLMSTLAGFSFLTLQTPSSAVWTLGIKIELRLKPQATWFQIFVIVKICHLISIYQYLIEPNYRLL